MTENDPEEMQKRVRYTDIIANALMVQNVADLTKALETLEQRGKPRQDILYIEWHSHWQKNPEDLAWEKDSMIG